MQFGSNDGLTEIKWSKEAIVSEQTPTKKLAVEKPTENCLTDY